MKKQVVLYNKKLLNRPKIVNTLGAEVLPHMFWARPILFTSPFQGLNNFLSQNSDSNVFLRETYSCYVEFIIYYAILFEWYRMPCPIHVNCWSSFHQRLPNIRLLGGACLWRFFPSSRFHPSNDFSCFWWSQVCRSTSIFIWCVFPFKHKLDMKVWALFELLP